MSIYIEFFYAGGNQLNKDTTKMFPNNFETLSNKIAHLDVARCNLKCISYLSNFHLFYIDARNNSISEVDKVFRDAIVSRKMENRALFSSSNPICSTSNGKDINCAKMCSDYCNYKNWEDDELYPHGTEPKYCDPRCKIKWDGFDCDIV